jgi:hypothetical protein
MNLLIFFLLRGLFDHLMAVLVSSDSGSGSAATAQRYLFCSIFFTIPAGETCDARGSVPPHWFLLQVRGCPQEAGGRGAETPRLLARDHEGQQGIF